MTTGYDSAHLDAAGNIISSDAASTLTSRTLQTVFLDRDGVINQKLPEGEYVSSWDRFTLIPGTAEAIRRLNQAELRVIVVTNQRGVALGKYTTETVDLIHLNLQETLARSGAHIDAFYFCAHDKKECDCRKPLPGMFHQAQTDFPEIAPASSVIVGDSLSDIQFGANLNLRTIFIEGDPEHRKAGAEKAIELANRTVKNLAEAVDLLLK
ncbi:D-glycero-alpha-D-manno-heptose-1,7-bisphosphate 7-phosphatase [Acidicapsa ligni]|uniref:D-glycero-alpha-D-manno-heptose-1,7-bisphosphate 7-phosphatase n=1 Tax=Acidicapsa ligni TaxID=542300 RepID=UPI0021E0CE55|nr:HAD family hydrolase [Acidicapsa ligni]